MFQLIKTKPVTIIRKEKGEYINGWYVESDYKEEPTLQIQVQPIKYHETLKLPESERTKKACKAYSKQPLRVLQEGECGHVADRFYWQDDLYEIIKLQNWDVQSTFCDHYCAYAVRVELTPDEVVE